MIPEPKCLVCGHALEAGPALERMRPDEQHAFSCPRCGFLIAQTTLESLTRDQDNGPL